MINSKIDFTNINYLKSGTHRQQKAHSALVELGIFEDLKRFNPILTGTIPLDIDLPESDLDIICECQDHLEFVGLLWKLFANQDGFNVKSYNLNGVETTVAKFTTQNFTVEIFAQNIPTRKQLSYRHMLIEHKILKEKGEGFKSAVRELKSKGIKTEPAFARLLGLNGNPYEEILKVKIDNPNL
jgi:hypothetical protein